MEQMELNLVGVQNLVRAIVSRAKRDFMSSPPGSVMHEETKQFFLSDYFTSLTGLQGEPILRDLQAAYDEKRQKKHRRDRNEDVQ